MDLLLPHTGTIFWMIIAFSVVLFVLKKFAWKPILNALKARDESIEEALKSAEKARQDMAQLQSDNEKVLAEAKLERDKIIKEARELKDEIINEAKKRAAVESDKVIENAREVIKSEKSAAVKEIKEQVADLSIKIAEKILEHNLADITDQKDLIDKFLRETKVN